MADSRPQADDFAQLQAMADGEDSLPAYNRPESLQLKRMQLMADSGPQAKGVAQLVPPGGAAARPAGNILGNYVRRAVNEVAARLGGIGARRHDYVTPLYALGRVNHNFNAAIAVRMLNDAPIYYTVPGAFVGRGGVIFGPREPGGEACAFLGGVS